MLLSHFHPDINIHAYIAEFIEKLVNLLYNKTDLTIFAALLNSLFNPNRKSPKLTHSGTMYITYYWIGTEILHGVYTVHLVLFIRFQETYFISLNTEQQQILFLYTHTVIHQE